VPRPAPARPADRAYAWLRTRILSGGFRPRAHLKEQELAARIGVSRSPVRDALRRLAGEGLVEMRRDRGTYVAQFTPAEVEEIFQLRAALEAYAASLAAQRIEPAELERLESLAGEMERAPRRGDEAFRRFAQLNNEFHLAILAAARSRRLGTLLRPLIDIPVVLLKHYNWQPGRVDIGRSNLEHRELIEALRARDPVWARTRMHAHVISRRPRRDVNGAAPAVAPPEIL
jgi:DNA-binding GntR family transcriptional regulator